MDQIINYLLLTIIFVFDPLAIALVIAANYAFERIRPKTKKNLYGEEVEVRKELHELDNDEEVTDIYDYEINKEPTEEYGFPEGYTSEVEELEKKIKNTPTVNKRGPKGLNALKAKLQKLKGKNTNSDDDLVIRY